ncbi:hypothetical protein KIN20_016705 [Parelaphostrongylus tenuis]|uniref:Uncharacterized protein n=1 Tax=Parelaphostrongylus tenuis TaxID=148309 RepID=A0AAD5QN41_PARTN|nr:hypothetical protein KIN20_016705 [Parelaphostrongylus tenuis]
MTALESINHAKGPSTPSDAVAAISTCFRTTHDCMSPNGLKEVDRAGLGVAGSSAVQIKHVAAREHFFQSSEHFLSKNKF